MPITFSEDKYFETVGMGETIKENQDQPTKRSLLQRIIRPVTNRINKTQLKSKIDDNDDGSGGGSDDGGS